MRILIEEYQYKFEDVSDILQGLHPLHDKDGMVRLSYVGYYYNPTIPDCVFILPKVVLEDEDGEAKVLGRFAPLDLVNPDLLSKEDRNSDEYRFLYELSAWIYRAISVFRDQEFKRYEDKQERPPSIVSEQHAPVIGHSRRKKQHHTFLDVLLAIIQWNKENQNFVTFILKNLHSGYNKINWNKTISKSQAIIQSQRISKVKESVIYLDPVNKKRTINFDEELLIIFYSILNYMKEEFGFPVDINVNFPLIKGEKFKKYRNGQGLRRLRQIKYKYFSDKALELWNLCYAFFETPEKATLNVDIREYLLVHGFQTVFEAIIDELIAGDQQLPKDLKDQRDGKRVDHIFRYMELVKNDSEKETYYIGDSKYYKRGNQLDDTSINKQFTYARNVIQWNMDLFNEGSDEEKGKHTKLRDDVTEGYNIIPNFFISAQQPDTKSSSEIALAQEPRKPYYFSRQYENRLFDRDTILLAHYDVNFLYVLSLYSRNKETEKRIWRKEVRDKFRREIQEMVSHHFKFFAMTAHAEVDAGMYIRENFKTVLGKVFQPFDHDDNQQYFSLALRDPEHIVMKDKEKERELKREIEEENESLLFQLRQSFTVKPCDLGVDPRTVLPKVEPITHREIPKQFLTMHHIENYFDNEEDKDKKRHLATFLVGCVNSEDHWHWIIGRKNKRDDSYNVRIGKNVRGSVPKSRDEIKYAKFVILYKFGEEEKGVFKVFRVKNTGELTKEQMMNQGYVDPHHDKYFCYFFDEEVTLGDLNVARIIDDDREQFLQKNPEGNYPKGRPIYLTARELIRYREV